MLELPLGPPAEPRRYPAPVSQQRALNVLESLPLPPDGRVLDAAYGSLGLLLDALALHGCRGVGLCRDADARQRAREAAQREGLAERVDLRVEALDAHVPERRYDAILLVGANLAPGALAETVAQLHEWLRVGGVLVYGQPFLRRPPVPTLRALLGQAAEGLRAGGVDARSVVNAGYELCVTRVMSETEWDAYESARYRAEVRAAAEHPDLAESRRRRELADAWFQAYWKYGRETLGYAFNLFRKPRAPLHAVS